MSACRWRPLRHVARQLLMKLALATMIGGITRLAAADSLVADRQLLLEEAIELALDNSADLELDMLAGRLTQTQLFVDARRLFPSLSIDYSASDTVAYLEPDSHTRRLGLSIRQPISGAPLDAYQDRRAELGITRLQARQRRQELAGRVIILYVAAIQARMQSAIMGETLTAGQQQLEIMQLELNSGNITRNDFLDQQLAIKNIELDYAQAQHNEWLARRRLGQLVLGAGTVATIGEINPEYDGILEEAELEALRAGAHSIESSNVELLSRRLESRIAKRNLDQATRFWIPNVSAHAELSLQGDRLSSGRTELAFGFDLRFPVPGLPISGSIRVALLHPNQRTLERRLTVAPFDGLDQLVSRQEAQLAFAQAQFGLLETQQQLEQEVRERLRSIEARRQRLALLQETLQMTNDRMRAREIAVSVGDATGIALLRDRIAVARLRVEAVDSIVALFQEELAVLHAGQQRPTGYERLIKVGEEQ